MAMDTLGVVAVTPEVDRSGGRCGARYRHAQCERSAHGPGEVREDRVEVGTTACEGLLADHAAAEVPFGHAHAAGLVATGEAQLAIVCEHDLGRAPAHVDHRDSAVRGHVRGDTREREARLLGPREHPGNEAEALDRLEQLLPVRGISHRAGRDRDAQPGSERAGARRVPVETVEHASDRGRVQRTARVDPLAESRDLEQPDDLAQLARGDVRDQKPRRVGAEIGDRDTGHMNGRASARSRSLSVRTRAALTERSVACSTSALTDVESSCSLVTRRAARIADRTNMPRPTSTASTQTAIATSSTRGAYGPCLRRTSRLSFRTDAGWSSPVARRAHNPKVAGSNPAPATQRKGARSAAPFFCAATAGGCQIAAELRHLAASRAALGWCNFPIGERVAGVRGRR